MHLDLSQSLLKKSSKAPFKGVAPSLLWVCLHLLYMACLFEPIKSCISSIWLIKGIPFLAVLVMVFLIRFRWKLCLQQLQKSQERSTMITSNFYRLKLVFVMLVCWRDTAYDRCVIGQVAAPLAHTRWVADNMAFQLCYVAHANFWRVKGLFEVLCPKNFRLNVFEEFLEIIYDKG